MTAQTFNLPFPVKRNPKSDVADAIRYVDRFFDDDAFAFDLLVCPGWKPGGTDERSTRQFLQQEFNGQLEIEASTLEHEVAPADALFVHLHEQQHRIDNRSDRYTEVGTISEILSVDAAQSRVFRSTCVKHGARLIRIAASVSCEHYPKLARDFQISVGSLRFRTSHVEATAESLQPTLATGGEIPFSFSLPQSWSIRTRVPGSAYEAECSARHPMSGRMLVFIRNGNYPLATLLRETKDKLVSEFKVRPGPAGIFCAAPQPRFTKACAVTYPLYQPNPSGLGELSIVCHEGGRYGLSMAMLSPSPGQDLQGWSRHKRAFELLSETIRFEDDSTVSREIRKVHQ